MAENDPDPPASLSECLDNNCPKLTRLFFFHLFTSCFRYTEKHGVQGKFLKLTDYLGTYLSALGKTGRAPYTVSCDFPRDRGKWGWQRFEEKSRMMSPSASRDRAVLSPPFLRPGAVEKEAKGQQHLQ